MDIDHVKILLEHYYNDTATLREVEGLYEQLDQHKGNEDWEGLLEELFEKWKPGVEKYDSIKWQPIIWGIVKQGGRVVHMERLKGLRVAVSVAVIIILTVISIVLFINKGGPGKLGEGIALQKDIPPGSEGAFLTLSDGRKVVLDSVTGRVGLEGGVIITNSNGKISYHQEKPEPSELIYNTVSTPKGRQYQLTLEDGTNVWLNAESSVRFPTSFQGMERVVGMTGEAYFEVKHHDLKPFKVTVGKLVVEVLGTHFNVNAYAEDSVIRTTLLNGKVRVIKGKEHLLLVPGEQAASSSNGKLLIVKDVDTEAIMAWKNGFFQFKGADIEAIMKQIQRWYDFEVSYPAGIPSGKYSGKISRHVNASHVLKVLEEGGVKFRIEGKRVIIIK